MANPLIKGLRDLSVVVIHAPDVEAQSLVQHLHRIGCPVEALWPPPAKLPSDADVVMIVIAHEYREGIERLLRNVKGHNPTIVALVDYENPTTLQMVLDSGAHAVIEKPVRPFGLLTNLALGRDVWRREIEAEQRWQKLDRKLNGMRKIGRAKSILMQTQGLSEDDAYKRLRDQAMAKRTTMEDIAVAIINAHDLLNDGAKLFRI